MKFVWINNDFISYMSKYVFQIAKVNVAKIWNPDTINAELQ